MLASKLKLKPDKTEFILFGSKKQRERLNVCFPIDILGNPLHPTESVRNLILLSLNTSRMFVKAAYSTEGF